MWPFGLGIIPTGAYQLRLVPTLHNIKNARPWEYFHLMAKKYGDFYSVQAGNFMGGMTFIICRNNPLSRQ